MPLPPRPEALAGINEPKALGCDLPMKTEGVLEAAVYVRDLVAAERFYGDVLGLRVIGRQPGRHVFFCAGQSVLLVFDPDATSRETVAVGGRAIPRHGASGPGHVALAVDAGALLQWRQRLQQCGVAIECEIAWPQGGHSIYVRDPSGNSVELATRSIWPQLAEPPGSPG